MGVRGFVTVEEKRMETGDSPPQLSQKMGVIHYTPSRKRAGIMSAITAAVTKHHRPRGL